MSHPAFFEREISENSRVDRMPKFVYQYRVESRIGVGIEEPGTNGHSVINGIIKGVYFCGRAFLA